AYRRVSAAYDGAYGLCGCPRASWRRLVDVVRVGRPRADVRLVPAGSRVDPARVGTRTGRQ
ncbi:hypothetical protein, partial [Streptomyces sp. NPDC050804]|uniref:hypothetical protein n=1 Tax=Streptomyces sp. NPDC050804 TaxID=3154745 RepID=UPI00343C5E30